MFSDSDLIKNIRIYEALDRVPFHTPMHLGRVDNPHDLSELIGLDNLQYPVSTLKSAEEYIAKVFKVKSSFLLTNGASIGLHAAILALKIHYSQKTLTLKPILLARNIHKSVLSAVILAGFDVEWLDLDYDSQLDLYIGLKYTITELKDYIIQNADKYSALVLTNPSYDGFKMDLSNLDSLPIPLIVDEAHGAHLYFDKNSCCETMSVADICIHSLHKTLGALTQGAVAHITHKSKISVNCYEMAIRLLQSTSPSYLIIESILKSINKFEAHGEEYFGHIKALRKIIHEDFLYRNNQDCFKAIIYNSLGLEERLMENNIFIEKSSLGSLTLFLSPYHKVEDIYRLNKVLGAFISESGLKNKEKPSSLQIVKFDFPEQVLNPQFAYLAPSEEIFYQKALGRISAELFAPCPPGFPLLVPGQKINQSIVDKLGTCDDFLFYKSGIIRVVG